jgi:hypothetical protein
VEIELASDTIHNRHPGEVELAGRCVLVVEGTTTTLIESLACDLACELAPVADLPEGKIQIFAIGAHPVAHSLCQGFFN